MTFFQQTLAEMRTYETGTAGHKDLFHAVLADC
jgi:hypothetical protein